MAESPARSEPGAEAFRFGACEIRLGSRQLLRDGEPVELQPKVFDFIAFLLLNRDRVVDKGELLDSIWPKQFVSDAALARCAMKARRALGDEADNPQVILTVHGRGYRFVAPATRTSAQRASRPASKAPWYAAAVLALAGLAIPAYLGWHAQASDRHAAAAGRPVRVAVWPVENATGDDRNDWARLGLMSAIGDILHSDGIATTGSREILDLEAGLAGTPAEHRLARMHEIHGSTHLVEARLGKHGGQYRLDYEVVATDGRHRPRSILAADIAMLAHAAGADLRVALDARKAGIGISADEFANEAYLRGRAMRLQGDANGAIEYFRLASEEVPASFWPRYELATALRDLGAREEATAMLESLLAEADTGTDPRARIEVRNALAAMHWRAGRNAESARLLDDALALAEALGDPEHLATVLISRGTLAGYVHDYDAARGYLHRAMAAETASGLEKPSGRLLGALAQVALREGDLAAARQHLEDSLSRFRLTGDRRNEAITLNFVANLHRREGRFLESRDTIERALAIHRELGDRPSEVPALNYLAIADAQLGHVRRSMTHAKAALRLAESIGDMANAAWSRSLLGQFSMDLGDLVAARDWLRSALEAYQAQGDRIGAYHQRRQLARLARAEGDRDAAERELTALLADLHDGAPPLLRVDVLANLGQLHLDGGDHEQAELRLREALAIAEPLGNDRRLAQLRVDLADVALARGDIAAAGDALAAAAVLADDPHYLLAQARHAAAGGDVSAAIRLGQASKAKAGERWQAADEARLQSHLRAAH